MLSLHFHNKSHKFQKLLLIKATFTKGVYAEAKMLKISEYLLFGSGVVHSATNSKTGLLKH